MEEFEETPPSLEPRNFTWFASYTKAMEMLPESERARFVIGVIGYGAYGNEPFFEYPLNAIFETIRPYIDKNVRLSQAGKKGGKKSRGKSSGSKA